MQPSRALLSSLVTRGLTRDFVFGPLFSVVSTPSVKSCAPWFMLSRRTRVGRSVKKTRERNRRLLAWPFAVPGPQALRQLSSVTFVLQNR